ncbi:MATE family efflux transporter [Empedobacter brevis]|uniref:MATE family efflux transporter n=1 Tax=Empedobacter brevis TaxID=247 RepID=UPI0039AF5899
MLITMGLTLITSRYILINLGVEDFGVYGVVAGVLGLFSFIQSTLVSASARFFSYELGNTNKLNKLYEQLNISISIHIIFAIFIFIIAEIFGVYLVNNFIVFPKKILFDVNILFQITIINTIVIFLGLPFEAVLTSLEKFKIYAYIKIIDTVGKFLVAYFLFFFTDFKLIYYSIGLLFISIIINLLYYYFSLENSNNHSFKFILNKKKLNPILKFFSLDLYGNLSIVLQSHGINILQNIFFGPIANASITISNQIHGAIGSFSNSVLIATKPQIIKAFASKEYKNFNSLINLATKISFIISLIVSVPIYFNLTFVLEIWLNNPPKYALIYSQLAIIINLLTISLSTINFAIHATGNIKWISFLSGSFYMLILPFTYIAFKIGYPTQSSYYIALVISLIICFINIYILKKLVQQFILTNFIKTLIRMIIAGSIIFFVTNHINKCNIISNQLINTIIISIIEITIVGIVCLIILFNKKEKNSIKNLLYKKLRK